MADPSEPPAPHALGEGKPSEFDLVSITDEMRQSYLDYAMSVIVSRALPDTRDGLKPVHRRILHAMGEAGYDWNKPYRKSARVVGDVIGKYHPHGDQAVYDALVRMAQEFSMRLPLIDGQGNFGSVDGDPPAAMRYTEVRLAKPAHSLLEDIEKDTVDFRDNYDGSEREPVVLPARFPNLLVNGAGGIAVGMATNIPPHNLGEVIDAAIALIDNPAITIDELTAIVPGPDFPTGGIILGRAGIRSAYHTGRGSILMRSRVAVETVRKEREALVVTEIPYQVNKATMIEKIAEMVHDKRIDGIANIRDESDRHGMRVVIELKREAMADIVLNQLYRFSALQTSFGANLVALNGGRPETLNLKDLLGAFVAFREEVVGRRTKHLLGKARDRAHVLVGLAIAVAHIDEVIRIIRRAKDPSAARVELMDRSWPAREVAPLIALIADPRHRISERGTYRLSDAQARAILELRLARLTALGRDEIAEELEKLAAEITDYLDILRSRERVRAIIKDELKAVAGEFATPRKTEIVDAEAEIEDEDLIQREDMVVTVTHAGWIKRVPLDTYRAQRRGGKGRAGMATREEDFVTRLFVASTHAPLLFFSSRGLVYKEKVWRLPVAAPSARGKALVNLLPMEKDERISTTLPIRGEFSETQYILMATRNGLVKKTSLTEYRNIRANGIIAINLDAGDDLIGVLLTDGGREVILSSSGGKAIRFGETDARPMGRNTRGVTGMRMGKGEHVIGMTIAAERTSLLAVSENGFGKRTPIAEYPRQKRGGQGVFTLKTGGRNGEMVGALQVIDDDQVMMITNTGRLVRIRVDGISVIGRNTQGVKLINCGANERVTGLVRVIEKQDEDDIEGIEDAQPGEEGGPEA